MIRRLLHLQLLLGFKRFKCTSRLFRLHNEWASGRVGEWAKKILFFSPYLPFFPSPHRSFIGIWFFVCILFVSALPPEAFGQTEEANQERRKTEAYEYSESPLRRFEIIFTISLPFTTIHSYAVVRGIKMIQERKVSPKFSKSDWRAVGFGAVGFSAFIGFWDWLHTHKHKPSQPRIPQTSSRNIKVDSEFSASSAKLEIVRFEF